MEFFRLPRFKRSPNASSIRLTDRDRLILRHVHQHRFLRSDHLTSLLGGSAQRIRRRLQLLYHHGYLDRPRCQIDYYHQGGSRSIAYGLGSKGAALLKRELKRSDWSWKNPVTRLFLEHALLVADVMVSLELAVQKRSDIRLLEPKKDRWIVAIGSRLNCGVVPDRVFGLERGNEAVWFCLEADRGTMPVKRHGLERSSFYRKLLAYAATWSQNLHLSRFGWQRFRVLTVTTNIYRLERMLEACRTMERGQGLCLFTDAGSFRQTPDVLALRWRTCHRGQWANLLD